MLPMLWVPGLQGERLNHQGKRQAIPLGLANKADVARRAREIYLSLITGGWEVTLAKFHPNHIQPQIPEREESEKSATVGEYLELASRITGVAPRTILGYVKVVRHLHPCRGRPEAVDPNKHYLPESP